MSDQKTVQQLKSVLFSEQGSIVFAVLDGASIPDLPGNLSAFEADHVCLLRNELKPDLKAAAPYLVRLESESRCTEWILSNGWGRHWGVFGVAMTDMRSLRDHFRKFLTVYDEKAESLFFRYYDPRVLQVFIPTCNKGELALFFGPVSRLLAESEDGQSATCFTTASGVLVQDHLKLKV